MDKRLLIPCPGCEHPLKVRTEYLGRKVTCKHCGKIFTAQAPPEGGALAELGDIERIFLQDAEASASRADDRIGLHDWPADPPATEGGEVRELATSLTAERLRSDELEGELAESHARLNDLRQQLDEAKERAEAASRLGTELND